MTYTFTMDWFSPWIGRWAELLGRLDGTPCQLLEIGSLEGRSAMWMADNLLSHPDSRLTCIDTWGRESIEARFDANLVECQRREQVIKIKGSSQDKLRFLKGQFDFVYIDGNHEGRCCLTDFALSMLLVHPGSLICFDDYGWTAAEASKQEGYHYRLPGPAIDAAIDLWGDLIEVVEKAYQVWVRVK